MGNGSIRSCSRWSGLGTRGCLVLFLMGCLAGSGCSQDLAGPGASGETGYRYQIPEQVGDGWTTGSLSSVQMDSTRLVGLMNDLEAHPNHGIHGLVVVKDGILVFEEYFEGGKLLSPGEYRTIEFGRDTMHFMASVSKSVTSMGVGVAVEMGALNLDHTIFQVFPSLSDLAGDGREDITIFDLITMRSGRAWDENTYPFGDPRNHLMQLIAADDPVRFVLGLPLTDPPGSAFHYHSGATNVLADAVRAATGERMDSLLDREVFVPMGVTEYGWEMLHGGIPFGSSGLHMRPRDMAKVGQLFLNQGSWGGQQLLSSDWIQQSTSAVTQLNWGWTNGYALGWWTSSYTTGTHGTVDVFMARGWGEQAVFVAPALDLVMVLTAGMYDGIPWRGPDQIWTTYILPAVG